jgi:hypothetical protein
MTATNELDAVLCQEELTCPLLLKRHLVIPAWPHVSAAGTGLRA